MEAKIGEAESNYKASHSRTTFFIVLVAKQTYVNLSSCAKREYCHGGASIDEVRIFDSID
jgi:hypothetical protein